jgi:hypothetical protein
MTTLAAKETAHRAGPSTERAKLLRRYEARIALNEALDRKLVSFQANRQTPFYGWFRYKEGFSARLVEYLLGILAGNAGTLLDPFAGAGSALFAARDMGWNAIGIEVLPVGFYSIQARQAAEEVKPDVLAGHIAEAQGVDFGAHWRERHALNHLTITQGAFPDRNERELVGYVGYCHKRIRNPRVRRLMLYAAFCVLEAISYTRKDGQYLRWDYRSNRSRGNKAFDKGEIQDFRRAVFSKLRQMLGDMKSHRLFVDNRRGAIDVTLGSCLDVLPGMRDETIDFVLTSPPYCNRYDYTRTYALELMFLGCDQSRLNVLRQQMLSCTVENREKYAYLRNAYAERNQLDRWERVDQAFRSQGALHEVLGVLGKYREQSLLNNPNIVKMVHNYFYEMCFVIYELARLLKRGGKAVIVNDNVRYAGEEVPVDLILCDFAESFRLRARHIWTLPRGKGNSSQQMGNHGRTELRKCVYVWEKF